MNDAILPSEGKTFIVQETKNVLVTKARNTLRGTEKTPKELLDLAKKLKNYKSFSYARRLLERASESDKIDDDNDLKLKIYQQWALCTYKDNDLPVDLRLDNALKILKKVENLDTTVKQETLGIVGAIYKRKWEVDNQKIQLELALLYYRRGYEQGAENDQGYTGINAAFVLDWLAFQEEKEGRIAKIESLVAKTRRERAAEIRRDILGKVTPNKEKHKNEWWFYSTLAESHFGLKQYREAVECLEEGRRNIGEVPEWEEESTVQQLARLAVFQGDPDLAGKEFQTTAAWRALAEAFGHRPAAVASAFTGKIGLALSGGGFRAALYHIGTLARLAELDVLRHVEVISCVSGGSIIGAHYYLELKKLLESKRDEGITKKDYIDIIERIEREFLKGVQRNIRVRVAAEFTTNLKMIFLSDYSRTKRAGELYESEIFSRVTDGKGKKARFLNDLCVCPKTEVSDFNPKLHNWRRLAKVPILMLNATTLNTGHNWQFTASWMGEPPSSIDTEIDTNDQLRRMYYDEAPAEHRKVRLGYAVSASAGVPGIFEPLSLENLYPNRTVRLVDGGVCDNQGVGSLLEQDCSVILVSDGSGQMVSENIPSGGLIGVPLRSKDVLQSRVRDAQYHDLERRRRSSLLRGLMFIHLKEDLADDPIDWLDCLDPIKRKLPQVLTRFGIDKKVQGYLAAMRTDLDSFSDIEAYTLMTSAYRMTEDAFKNKRCVDGFTDEGAKGDWKFLAVESDMRGDGRNYERIKNLLSVSDSIAFKIWKQSPALKILAMFLAVAALAVIIAAFIYFSEISVISEITVQKLGVAILTTIGFAILTYFLGFLVNIIRWRETLTKIAFGIVMCFVGWLAARLHLHIFDKWFLRRGSLRSLSD